MKIRVYAFMAVLLILVAMVCTGCSEKKCLSCDGSLRCWNCNGTGYCELCYGEGRYFELLTDRYERCYCSGGRCTICLGNGVCKNCKGTGLD